MGKIIVLDELTANKIAAGEVIERPASVVKELVENSIDAGADNISIEIKSGGIKYIRITDNGQGFEPDDAVLAFDKHATSKIRVAEDLEKVNTLGFRGEALPSIASVSRVKLVSKTEDGHAGIFVHLEGGDVIEVGETACAKGTSLEVMDLFFNTPARYKFLKKDHVEASYVTDTIEKIALANPNVSFKLISNGKTVLQTPGNEDLQSTIYAIFGRDVATKLKEVKYEESHIKVNGYVGDISLMYSNRNRQIFFVNGRYIKNKTLTAALDKAYSTLAMKGKFPFCVLSVRINPMHVDVNVHPAKIEVRFDNESLVFEVIYRAIMSALFGDRRKTETAFSRTYQNPAPSQEKRYETKPVTFETFEQYLKIKEEEIPLEDEVDVKVEVSDKREEIKEEAEAVQIPIIQSAAEVVKEPEVEIENFPPAEKIINERVENNKRDNDVFEFARIIGQVWNAYILFEHENKLYMMDQHAAHERIMYEELRKMVNGSEPMVQMLLSPITMELSPSEFQTLKNNFDYFSKLGIEMEEFGSASVIIRTLPTILLDENIHSFIQEGLDNIKKGGETSLYDDETIFQMACKAAVKANKKLDIKEMEELMKRMSTLDNPFTCPHGRPIVVEITKYEIEKRFKRK